MSNLPPEQMTARHRLCICGHVEAAHYSLNTGAAGYACQASVTTFSKYGGSAHRCYCKSFTPTTATGEPGSPPDFDPAPVSAGSRLLTEQDAERIRASFAYFSDGYLSPGEMRALGEGRAALDRLVAALVARDAELATSIDRQVETTQAWMDAGDKIESLEAELAEVRVYAHGFKDAVAELEAQLEARDAERDEFDWLSRAADRAREAAEQERNAAEAELRARDAELAEAIRSNAELTAIAIDDALAKEALEAEVTRLRAALEFYADPTTWTGEFGSGGAVAREALNQEATETDSDTASEGRPAGRTALSPPGQETQRPSDESRRSEA